MNSDKTGGRALSEKLKRARESEAYREAIHEDVVDMVARMVNRGGVIPAVARTNAPAVSFPEWLKKQMDDYAESMLAERKREVEDD